MKSSGTNSAQENPCGSVPPLSWVPEIVIPSAGACGTTLQSFSVLSSVLWPESFRGGCSFGTSELVLPTSGREAVLAESATFSQEVSVFSCAQCRSAYGLRMMNNDKSISPTDTWLDHPDHRTWLAQDAAAQLKFFEASLQAAPGFATLDHAGDPLPDETQELHTTTRLVHSYALGALWGYAGADTIVDHGMRYLMSHHHDADHGGFLWALRGADVVDDRKLAYGQMFVLLAGASAKIAGHPDADALIANATDILTTRYWDEDAGLYADEFNRDWTPFSTYRGMNANMHGVEAHLAAFEATGVETYLTRAGRILDFFTDKIARAYYWRLPEHYHADWSVDRTYSGDPMFRPAGTTPGHSFELGRLLLQYWDLTGRADDTAPIRARHLIYIALNDAWRPDGGIAYTLDFDGQTDIGSRFWWPVTEAIGAVAALIKIGPQDGDEVWYRRLWAFSDQHFIDHSHGGWFPAIDEDGKVTSSIFNGKPDIYHALQASLFALTPRLSCHADDLKDMT